MSKIEEMREAFLEAMDDTCIEGCEHHGSKYFQEHNITIAADAYALQAHVDVCRKYNTGQWPIKHCGDGWYCNESLTYKESSCS